MSWLLTHLTSNGLISRSSATQLMIALGMNAPAEPSASQKPIYDDKTFKTLTFQAAYDPSRVTQLLKSSRELLRAAQVVPGTQAIIVNGRVRIHAVIQGQH